VDHCFAQLLRYFPRGNKTDPAALDTLNPAFRQNFDNISPATTMNDRCGIGATGVERAFGLALRASAGLRRNGLAHQ
jgi:hypothetical protein